MKIQNMIQYSIKEYKLPTQIQKSSIAETALSTVELADVTFDHNWTKTQISVQMQRRRICVMQCFEMFVFMNVEYFTNVLIKD